MTAIVEEKTLSKKEEFQAKYGEDIPKGNFQQVTILKAKEVGIVGNHHDTTHDVSILNTDGDVPTVTKFGSFTHSHFAGFTEDLINAYFAGELVWKEDCGQKD